jgi:hypothetical protein
MGVLHQDVHISPIVNILSLVESQNTRVLLSSKK